MFGRTEKEKGGRSREGSRSRNQTFPEALTPNAKENVWRDTEGEGVLVVVYLTLQAHSYSCGYRVIIIGL